MLKLWKITLFGIIATIIVIIWIFVIGISSDQPGSFYNKDENAVWLERTWVTEKNSTEEIGDLVRHLKSQGIKTVFVHSGPLNEDGTIDSDTYHSLTKFLEEARKFNNDIEYQAWLGQLRKKIDLSKFEIRHEIANQCLTLTEIVGFDGIHYDIEPVWDEDYDFIELLRETNAILADDKKLSVALAEFIPSSVIWLLEDVREFENYNTEENYRNVALYADQIVVMVYDTSIQQDWLYRWMVKEQTIRVTSLIEDKEVFIGIPSYEEESEAFNPKVENIENALKGVIDGLNNI
ncbi:glycosyl hydrolase family 18 protein, partial [Patescibacteria group bacterium]